MNIKNLFAIMNVLVLIAAIITLCYAWNSEVILSALAILMIETVILFWFTLDLIGKIKPYVYQFNHLLNLTDRTQFTTCILVALEKEETLLLMSQYKIKRLSKLFTNGVRIESCEPVKLNDGGNWKKYKGYVYASNINEADKILKNYQFSDPDSGD